MPLSDNYRPDHEVGQVNVSAWTGAERARRILQQRRAAGQVGRPTGATPEGVGVDPEALKAGKAALRQAAKAAQEAHYNTFELPAEEGYAGGRPGIFTSPPENFESGSIAERLHQLGEKPIAMQMRARLVGSQAPEPVMEVITHDQAEGAKYVRRWAVDDEEFGKKAGDEMTDEEYQAVCRRMKPVHWDKDGNPDMWRPVHDVIDPNEGLGKTVPTRREREQAKQYAVRVLASEGMGGDHVLDTDHTILPDPYVEPTDPDLP